jgi:DNA-binding NarL/FixJ family response regulator
VSTSEISSASREADDTTSGRVRPVSIALVNDHELVVRGLQRMLEEFQHRVRVVELDVNAEVAQSVDVALYDTFSVTQVTAADIDGLLSAPRVTAVAVYSWNMHQELVEAAMRKGVRGYLSKSLDGAELVAALERVAAGDQVVLPRADVGQEVTASGRDWPGRERGLSARQAEVVSLITQGLSNTDIAERTYLSPNTVKSYIREAYRTMGVSSRTQAVLWGIENGLMPSRTRIVTGSTPGDP